MRGSIQTKEEVKQIIGELYAVKDTVNVGGVTYVERCEAADFVQDVIDRLIIPQRSSAPKHLSNLRMKYMYIENVLSDQNLELQNRLNISDNLNDIELLSKLLENNKGEMNAHNRVHKDLSVIIKELEHEQMNVY